MLTDGHYWFRLSPASHWTTAEVWNWHPFGLQVFIVGDDRQWQWDRLKQAWPLCEFTGPISPPQPESQQHSG